VVRESIAPHIFVASAGLVGACLTVLGIVQVVITTKAMDTVIDELLAVDATIFLVSCVLAYWVIRQGGERRQPAVERLADVFFGAGLLLMVVICVLITYAID
jgi:hypothetical protein